MDSVQRCMGASDFWWKVSWPKIELRSFKQAQAGLGEISRLEIVCVHYFKPFQLKTTPFQEPLRSEMEGSVLVYIRMLAFSC